MEIAREIQIIKDRLNLGVQRHEITEINSRLDALEFAALEIRAEVDGLLSRLKGTEEILREQIVLRKYGED